MKISCFLEIENNIIFPFRDVIIYCGIVYLFITCILLGPLPQNVFSFVAHVKQNNFFYLNFASFIFESIVIFFTNICYFTENVFS